MSGHEYPLATWRLLMSSATDGATNMATDEAIIRAVAAGIVPPTLRLYAWQPPCLSLGRAQPGAEVDRVACSRDGVHVVRRSTGGRAILHTDELTYSVVAPPDEPRLRGDIITSYRRISLALLAALQWLGIDAESRAQGHDSTEVDGEAKISNAVCFEVPSHYEITTADGRKLVGSAQMRTARAILQHGTLPLRGDIARICRYLADPPEPDRVRARAATMESVLGQPVAWNTAAESMVSGFKTALNVMLAEGELTADEQGWLIELGEKYASDGWTWRV